jgi:hypothetical protein
LKSYFLEASFDGPAIFALQSKKNGERRMNTKKALVVYSFTVIDYSMIDDPFLGDDLVA